MTALPRLAATAKALLKPLCGAALACALLVPALPGTALAISDDPVLKRMDSVLEENQRLRDEAWKARRQGKDASRQADDALNASDERVEKTRAEALAHVAGVSPAQVESLRKDGRSWGQAAGELGVHPGFLGVGKTPIYEPQSVRRKAAAEARLTKKGKKAEVEAEAKPAKKQAKGQKDKAKPAAKAAKAEQKPAKKGSQKAAKKDDQKPSQKAGQKSEKSHKKAKKAD